MIDEIAVVKKTIAETRSSSERYDDDGTASGVMAVPTALLPM